MNREFKFRVWWIGQQKFDYIDSFKKFSSYSFPLDWCVIQQYTGLKDSQGREIYEGDILDSFYEYEYEEPWGSSGYALDDFNGAVEYDDESAMFFVCSPMLRSGRKTFPEIRLNKTTVIGNIYENPELLKNERD